jgi:hypothetical protein
MTFETKINEQWASRPDDERFVSLDDLHAHVAGIRDRSVARKIVTRDLTFTPVGLRGLACHAQENGADADLTHWAFGQAAARAQAPAGYLRTLPAPMAADCLNYGLRQNAEEIQILATRAAERGKPTMLRALTGPSYGRVWNAAIVEALRERFGDGVSGQWAVPREFGVKNPVTKGNTTLYASDRDFFVALTDEENRIEVPNVRSDSTGRSDGRRGLSRGFIISNSETGAGTLWIALFLFDYICCNRLIWGLGAHTEIRVRHSSGAPQRWLDEVLPAVRTFSESTGDNVIATIEAAQDTKITHALTQQERDDDILKFLASRFTRTQAGAMIVAHQNDEGRPIETLYDASNAVTAYARGVQWQDERVDLERAAGKILAMAA